MIYKVPYGTNLIQFELANNQFVDFYTPKSARKIDNPIHFIKKCIHFDEIIRSNSHVAIAINDHTRPVPNNLMLPPLLLELHRYGIEKKNIIFLISTGTHKKLTKKEIASILPQNIINEYRIVCHNCDSNSLVYLGKTKIGTPISVNPYFAEADIKIVTGNIEPHHFMGYSGGVKSAAIGLTSRETITKNHSLIFHPKSFIGEFEENPMRQDIEEIGEIIGVDYALNTVLNWNKEIVDVFWGKPSDVIRKGVICAQQICQVPIKKKYDLVISSAGGFPKDINLYQAQKAITHASLIAKRGAVIILIAACAGGIGNSLFFDQFKGKNSMREVINSVKKIEFSIGPHKAYQLASQGLDYSINLVSELEKHVVRTFLLHPYTTAQLAIDDALKAIPRNPHIAVLPYATNTIAITNNQP